MGHGRRLGADLAGSWSPVLRYTPLPTRVRVSGSPPGLRGRCRRGRAGGAGARERAARSKRRAGGRGPPRTGGLVDCLRRAGLGDGGRAARERAGGVAAAAAGDARGRCLGPLLHGAAGVPRAAPRRAPQGSKPAGDGGALPGLGHHPGFHQSPPAEARQGEDWRGPASSGDAVPRLCCAARTKRGRSRAESGMSHGDCTFLGWCCLILPL